MAVRTGFVFELAAAPAHADLVNSRLGGCEVYGPEKVGEAVRLGFHEEYVCSRRYCVSPFYVEGYFQCPAGVGPG